MVHTVTLLTDHLGSDRPAVVGHEYRVDALINVTDYVVAGEVITAASLGLTSITMATICGHETDIYIPKILVDTDGTYNSDSQFNLKFITHDASDSSTDAFIVVPDGATDLGMVRLRVWGLI